jgi:biopolymer transport protein ExbB
MGGFALRDMIINGWPVLSVLLVFSIISVTVIWDRWMALRDARTNARALAGTVVQLIEERGATAALHYCDQVRKPAAAVFAEILLQPGDREAKERAMQHGIQAQIAQLKKRVAYLGTIGSTAPFVGLLGTVVGIIKAFRDISVNVGGGPEVVSAGIAEALITTAFGLVVAIPAVIFYNVYVIKIENLLEEIQIAGYVVIEELTGGRK